MMIYVARCCVRRQTKNEAITAYTILSASTASHYFISFDCFYSNLPSFAKMKSPSHYLNLQTDDIACFEVDFSLELQSLSPCKTTC